MDIIVTSVNGGWTEWSVWSDCPETCGNEDLIRTRSCTNPSPENNGTVCQGSNTETISCTTAQCPGKNTLNGVHY